MPVSLPDRSPSQPPRVVSLQVDYDEVFKPGDPYTVALRLNRPLDAYEEARVKGGGFDFPAFDASGSWLRVWADINKIEADALKGLLDLIWKDAKAVRDKGDSAKADIEAERVALWEQLGGQE